MRPSHFLRPTVTSALGRGALSCLFGTTSSSADGELVLARFRSARHTLRVKYPTCGPTAVTDTSDVDVRARLGEALASVATVPGNLFTDTGQLAIRPPYLAARCGPECP